VRHGLASLLGQVTGMGAMLFAITLGLGNVLLAHPLALMLAALPSCLPWLAFGAAFQRFLRSPRAWRIFNAAMAALLAASTIPLVWTGV